MKKTFRWVVASKNGLCHRAKCPHPAVENRLCAEDNAIWLAQGQQPAMPPYGHHEEASLPRVMADIARQAKADYEAVAGARVRLVSDVQELRQRAAASVAGAEELTERRNSSIRPIMEMANKVAATFDPAIETFLATARLANERIAEAERSGELIDLAQPAKRRQHG